MSRNLIPVVFHKAFKILSDVIILKIDSMILDDHGSKFLFDVSECDLNSPHCKCIKCYSIEELDGDIVKKIVAKINFCLDTNLFESIFQCNKKPLKGSKKGNHRLHFARIYTVIYDIQGEKPNRYPRILDLMTIEPGSQKIWGVIILRVFPLLQQNKIYCSS